MVQTYLKKKNTLKKQITFTTSGCAMIIKFSNMKKGATGVMVKHICWIGEDSCFIWSFLLLYGPFFQFPLSELPQLFLIVDFCHFSLLHLHLHEKNALIWFYCQHLESAIPEKLTDDLFFNDGHSKNTHLVVNQGDWNDSFFLMLAVSCRSWMNGEELICDV